MQIKLKNSKKSIFQDIKFSDSKFLRCPRGGPKKFFDPKNHFNVDRMVRLEFRKKNWVKRQPYGAAIDRGRLGLMIVPPPVWNRVKKNLLSFMFKQPSI